MSTYTIPGSRVRSTNGHLSYDIQDRDHQPEIYPQATFSNPRATVASSEWTRSGLKDDVRLRKAVRKPNRGMTDDTDSKELPLPNDTATPIVLLSPKLRYCGIKKRMVRMRDRKITACTQCRDRKLKCNRGHPCSHCQSKGEKCLYIAHASDLHRAPRREVKTRKRAINVCWNCRTRKIPCDKGLPCSHCKEGRIQCFYKRYEPKELGWTDAGQDTRTLATLKESDPTLKPAQQFFVNKGPVELSFSALQNNAPAGEDWDAGYQLPAKVYQHLWSSSRAPSNMQTLAHNGYPQPWENTMSFADNHAPTYNEDGYGAFITGIHYQRDNTHTLPENENHCKVEHNAGQHFTPSNMGYPTEQAWVDGHKHASPLTTYDHTYPQPLLPHGRTYQSFSTPDDYAYPQSLPPLRDMVKTTSSPQLNGNHAFLHNSYSNHNQSRTLPSMPGPQYPWTYGGGSAANGMSSAKAIAHMYG